MIFVHDSDRPDRIGMPQSVLCSTKTPQHLAAILTELSTVGRPTLCTRFEPQAVDALHVDMRSLLDFEPLSRTAFLNGCLPARLGSVAIVAAGTSDHAVAAEAERMLEFSGLACDIIIDVGVAGLWRLQDRLDDIQRLDVVTVVAGMDAALVSVLGGLVSAPVIAVPTSVGYGVAAGGHAALASALASCAQGVVVVNIDNGFGAACAALRMLGAHPTEAVRAGVNEHAHVPGDAGA